MKSSLRLVEVEAEYLKTVLNHLHHILVGIYDRKLVRVSTDESTVVLGWALRVAYKESNCLGFNLSKLSNILKIL